MNLSRFTIPNCLSISRLFLVPVFITLFWEKKYIAAFIVLTITALTDVADGFIARRFNQRSRLGSLLDPMADKTLMIVSFVFLAYQGYVPWGLTSIVLGKDFWVITGVCVLNLMKIRLYYRPTILSKVTTASQILVLIFSFVKVLAENNPQAISPPLTALISPVQNGLILWAGFITLVTAGQYTFIGYKFYRFGERKS